MAYALYLNNWYGRAIELFSKLKKNPVYKNDLLAERAYCYYMNGFYDQALAIITRAGDFDPEDGYNW